MKQQVPRYHTILLAALVIMTAWPGAVWSKDHRQQRLGSYLTLQEFYDEIESLAAKRPDLVKMEVIGQSVNGRPIYLCRLGKDDPHKPAILYTGNIHGNENTAGHMALAVLRYFVENEGQDPLATQLVDEVSIWIVPLLNPDGYFKTTDRQLKYGQTYFHRKNGHRVDLNRNFPYNPEYKSLDPRSGSNWLKASPSYRGPHPLSEPETRALQSKVLDLRRFEIAIGFHTSGGLIVFPWGRQPEPTDDDAKFREIAGAYQLRQTYLGYDIRQSYSWYPVIGNLNDYLYNEYGTLSYTIELGRPKPLQGPGLQKLSIFWMSNERDLECEIENNLEASIHMAEWAILLHKP